MEERWGVTFANVAAMTRHHGQHKRPPFPLSRLFTFEEGKSAVRIQCYLHTDDYAAQGWYVPAERTAPSTALVAFWRWTTGCGLRRLGQSVRPLAIHQNGRSG